jgi:tetratricopeptide (TPR) repeat protein
MSKTQIENTEEPIIDVEQAYSKTEHYIEENKNRLATAAMIIVALVGGYFAYKYLYIQPMDEEAQKQMWKAEQYFEKDSFDLALNGDGNYFGFLQIIEDYSLSKTANLAHYYAGISYLRKGEYETAIEYLDNFDSDDEILAAIATGATGDAYMELGKTEEALSHYVKAAEMRDNQFTASIYLMKAGLAYELQGNYSGAKKVYEKIKKDYAETNEGRNVDKYLARVESYVN